MKTPDNSPPKKNETKHPAGIIIAAMKGGAGKTIATLGLIRAMALDGKRVIPFKKGPDYIDARWMAMAAYHDCYNLDPYLMSREIIEKSYVERASTGDISIIEGNRGLHDGVDVEGTCSTAELAKWLRLPVFLVADCTKVTRTVAALVMGCRDFDREVNISGVILNHIVRPRHQDIVSRSIEHYTGIPVVGAIRRLKSDPLPMRHLGLTPADEHKKVTELLDTLGETIRNSVDITRIMDIAQQNASVHMASNRDIQDIPAGTVAHTQQDDSRPTVGIIRDQAFQFYYPENLEAIKNAGANLIFLDSINNTEIPDHVDAIYIGGGFPETQADRLAANISFRQALREKAMKGMPIYAECGGLMYLGQNIVWQGKRWPMTGILSWDFRVHKKPAGHGYTILEVVKQTPFFRRGTILKGHEFHYSVPEPGHGASPCHNPSDGDERLTCRVRRGNGFSNGMEGITTKNVFGTYTHVHAIGHPDWGKNIVRAATAYRSSGKL